MHAPLAEEEEDLEDEETMHPLVPAAPMAPALSFLRRYMDQVVGTLRQLRGANVLRVRIMRDGAMQLVPADPQGDRELFVATPLPAFQHHDDPGLPTVWREFSMDVSPSDGVPQPPPLPDPFEAPLLPPLIPNHVHHILVRAVQNFRQRQQWDQGEESTAMVPLRSRPQQRPWTPRPQYQAGGRISPKALLMQLLEEFE